MTHIDVSDELASRIATLAASLRCTTEELLQRIVWQAQADDAEAQDALTPALQARMLEDKERVARGEFVTEEEVDRKFAALYTELAAKELVAK